MAVGVGRDARRWWVPIVLGTVLVSRVAVAGGTIALQEIDHLLRQSGSVREFLTSSLDLDTTVELLCQRCLEPFAQPIKERLELMLVEPGASSASIPEGYEPIELDDGRLLPARLIEDELIVSIPLVPKHARIEDCGSLARNLTN